MSSALTTLQTRIDPYVEDLADPASRKQILDDFSKQFTIMKSSLSIGKEVGKRSLPYDRKLIPNPAVSILTAPPPRVSGGARNEPRNQGQASGMGETDCKLWS